MHFRQHMDMQRYICICVRSEHTLTTQAHCVYKHRWGQIFCSRLKHAASCMMKWIWLITRKRNSITPCVTLFQSPSLFCFFFTRRLQASSTSPDSTIIIHSPSSALHLSFLLLQTSLHRSYFLCSPLSSVSLPSPLVFDLRHTPRQTVEQSDSLDQT